MTRLTTAWQTLAAEQRLAAVAALATMLSTVLPWYSITPVRGSSRTVSAFGVYSFVEAAIFLVALAVLALLFARGERRAFHLPGGDGAVITAAGAWVVFLVFYRQFDKPEVQGALVGVEWGIFVTVLAGAGLALAGLRLRAAHVPEPDGRPRRRRDRSEAPTAVVRRDPDPGPDAQQLSFDDQDRAT